MQGWNHIGSAAGYLEIKEVIEPEDVLGIVWVVLLQQLQQLYFIQALVEKVFAVFDNLPQSNKKLNITTEQRQI
jgi:hypothetical protein